MRLLYLLAFLFFYQTANALEFVEVKIPAALKKTYDMRFDDPLNCIDQVNSYRVHQKAYINKLEERLKKQENNPESVYAFPIHLLAFCHLQVEDYSYALKLLTPLLKTSALSTDKVTTLKLIALNIPEENRAPLSNPFLLTIVQNTLQNSTSSSPNMIATLYLTFAHLSLQENHFQEAYRAIESARKLLDTKDSNKKITAWIEYYYGRYYTLINQPQLAITSLLSANKLAEKYSFTKLSGQVKQAIAHIYQSNHRFKSAVKYSSQQVELYQNTKNEIKKVNSLIELAVLKRQNNEHNQSVIYLLNALDIIQSNKNPMLHARLYLELGRTYLDIESKQHKNLMLAQKYLQNARLNFASLNKPRFQMESLLLLAKLNIINNDPALAILQLEKALQIAPDKYISLRMKAYQMLAESYEVTGFLPQAISHFKKFHALQNTIEAHLFEMQQLQVTEQLVLLEKNQQQKQLKLENTQLKEKSEQFQVLTYSSGSLLLFICLLYFYTLIRNRKLNTANRDAQLRLSFHPRTKLPFQYADSSHFQYVYHDQPLYYALLNIPFLSQLNELLGTEGARAIEKKLGEELKNTFSGNIDIFQFRGNQILFIAKQKNYRDAGELGQQLQGFFTDFGKKQKLEQAISCGIVAFPFLKNASRAISPSQTLNLSSLALSASSQIRKQKHQSSWVELYAIDNLQPAFLNGDLWQLTKRAINTGIVKTNSSHLNFKFNWL